MADVTITVRENGPYLVRGLIDIVGAAGNHCEVARSTVLPCRCGGSTTRPFRDGTHSRIGFAAATRAVQASVTSGK